MMPSVGSAGHLIGVDSPGLPEASAMSSTISDGLGSQLGPIYARGRKNGSLPLTSALINAQNGIDDLEANAILLKRPEREREPLSASGYTTRIYYSLTGEYSQTSRRALQEEATRIVTKRAADTAARALAGEPAGTAEKSHKRPRKRLRKAGERLETT